MPSDPVKAFSFLFYLQNHFRNWDAQREELTDVQREKEREKERLIDAVAQPQTQQRDCAVEFAPPSSQFASPISLFLDLPLPFEPGLTVAASRRSQSQHRVAWSRLHLRRAISPLIEPSRLSLFLLLSIWSDLMIFFLGFVCVFLLRNEWYYIFVWQLRKCEQQVENMFSMVFSRTQPNTRKYFSKHFLKCNQTLENNFISWK